MSNTTNMLLQYTTNAHAVVLGVAAATHCRFSNALFPHVAVLGFTASPHCRFSNPTTAPG